MSDQFNDDGSLNEEEFPVVSPGVTVYIQMKDRSCTDANGVTTYYMPDEVVPMIVHPVDSCWPNLADGDSQEVIDAHDVGEENAHQSTVCSDCIPSWSRDHYITLGDTPYDLGLRERT